MLVPGHVFINFAIGRTEILYCCIEFLNLIMIRDFDLQVESPHLLILFYFMIQTATFIPAVEEDPAETEPKFSPFTGVGRRLDGKPLKPQPGPVPLQGSKDKEPAVANGRGQHSVGSSSENTSRQSQGKLVFGSNVSRASKETQKVPKTSFLIKLLLFTQPTEIDVDHRTANRLFFDCAGSWKRGETRTK